MRLERRVRRLVAGTITCNVVEGIVAVAAGVGASSAAQRQAGRRLGSARAVADSKQTLLCTYLAAVLLVGLGLNSLYGWSWADALAALVIAAVAVCAVREALRGDTCCAVSTTKRSSALCEDACCAGQRATDAILPTPRGLATAEPRWGRPAERVPRRRGHGDQWMTRCYLPGGGEGLLRDGDERPGRRGDGRDDAGDDGLHGGRWSLVPASSLIPLTALVGRLRSVRREWGSAHEEVG